MHYSNFHTETWLNKKQRFNKVEDVISEIKGKAQRPTVCHGATVPWTSENFQKPFHTIG